MNKIVFKDIKDFNLDHIFLCGQCFRWEPVDITNAENQAGIYEADWEKPLSPGYIYNSKQRYLGIAGRYFALMEYEPYESTLTITGNGDEGFWRNYLDLDRDYGDIKTRLIREDSTIEKAIDFGSGIRILNQDPWETIVSFIISQNNHIPRIKGCINNLALHFGDEIEGTEIVGDAVGGDFRAFSVPSPEVMGKLTVEDLAPIRLGYRAKYLVESAKQVCERGLPGTYEELLSLTGVGPKVANCIALFGLGERQSFPIDVWVKRVMNHVYGLPEDDLKGIAEFAGKKFGDLGGYAQQYLFYYMRELDRK